MLKGFYSAASGMIAQQRRTEMLTNNLANVNTTGYKADQATLRSFPELLMDRYSEAGIPNQNERTTGTSIGSMSTSVYMQEAIPKFTQGSLKETNKDTDLALLDQSIEGATIFFAVQSNNGQTKYTRNGNFDLDNEGFLVTKEGNFVLDTEDEKIQISTGNLKINRSGEVFDGNQLVSKVQVVLAENPNDFVKEDNGLFRNTGGNVQSAYGETNFTIEQGYTESSNVDMNTTMTDLTVAYRSFEANQKILQAMDRSLEKAVNEIGRIR